MGYDGIIHFDRIFHDFPNQAFWVAPWHHGYGTPVVKGWEIGRLRCVEVARDDAGWDSRSSHVPRRRCDPERSKGSKASLVHVSISL